LSKTQSNQVGSIDRVYAQALLKLAEPSDQVDSIGDELKQLGTVLDKQWQLLELLSSPALSMDQRTQSIEAIFKDRVSDLVYRFIQVVNVKGRLDRLPGIVRAFAMLQNERAGIVEADLFVAKPLSKEQAQSISDGIGQAMGHKVKLKEHVDPTLIGGLKILVGDRLIDGCVSTQLRLLSGAITASGQEKVRTQMAALIQD